MSIRSLTELAAQRDQTPQGTKVGPASVRGLVGGGAAAETVGSAITSTVPTEVLAPYTAVVALVEPLVKQAPGAYVPLRWTLFAVFLVLTVGGVVLSYERKRPTDATHRRFPYAELGAAALAFVAWALVLPGSALGAQLPSHLHDLVLGLITIGAGVALALLTGRELTFGAKPPATAAPGTGAGGAA